MRPPGHAPMHGMLTIHMHLTVCHAYVLGCSQETQRHELMTFSARWRALSVSAVRLRLVLGTTAKGRAMRHRERGARALDSSTSLIVRIAHDERASIFASPGEPSGLGMCVLDVGIGCLACITNASGVAGLEVRSNGSK